MSPNIGVNLRVTGHCNQGDRKYMEDVFSVAYQQTADKKDLEYAFFGIFDGHGGREAAQFAKENLMDFIVSQNNFWSDDDDLVLKAIREGFIATHQAMWKELERWPRAAGGLPSTSGCTASVVFVRRAKIYIGHVGDSAIILGYQCSSDTTEQSADCGQIDGAGGSCSWQARCLTRDHKPESREEHRRIALSGGKVMNKSGVSRVVWNRPRAGHCGPVRRSTELVEIPFLAVARSLGDLWSYNWSRDSYAVSPEPDVAVLAVEVHQHRCLVLATDGVCNMVSPSEAVACVAHAELFNQRWLRAHAQSGQERQWINPSKRLVDLALSKWKNKSLRADNASVVTVMLDRPGPPKLQLVRNKRARHCSSSSMEGMMDGDWHDAARHELLDAEPACKKPALCRPAAVSQTRLQRSALFGRSVEKERRVPPPPTHVPRALSTRQRCAAAASAASLDYKVFEPQCAGSSATAVVERDGSSDGCCSSDAENRAETPPPPPQPSSTVASSVLSSSRLRRQQSPSTTVVVASNARPRQLRRCETTVERRRRRRGLSRVSTASGNTTAAAEPGRGWSARLRVMCHSLLVRPPRTRSATQLHRRALRSHNGNLATLLTSPRVR